MLVCSTERLQCAGFFRGSREEEEGGWVLFDCSCAELSRAELSWAAKGEKDLLLEARKERNVNWCVHCQSNSEFYGLHSSWIKSKRQVPVPRVCMAEPEKEKRNPHRFLYRLCLVKT